MKKKMGRKRLSGARINVAIALIVILLGLLA